jgi:replicative DNA helicase
LIIDQKAEEYALGCMIYEGHLATETRLRQEHFLVPENNYLMKHVEQIVRRGELVDVGTLTIELGNDGMLALNNMRGLSYITDLALSIPSTEPFRFYEDKVLLAFRMTKAQERARTLLEVRNTANGETILSEMQEIFTELNEIGKVDEENDLGKAANELYEDLLNPINGLTGISSGFNDLDRMTLGWQSKDLIIIGARPSMGKTAFVLNCTINALKDENTYVHLFSLEMARKPIMQRMWGTWGRIDAQRLRSRHLNEEDHTKLNHTLTWWSSIKNRLDIYDKMGMTLPEIRANVAKKIRRNPDKKHLVIVDYLTIMGYHGNPNTRHDLKVGDNSTGLKKMAKELDCAVICLAQLSRGVETRADKRPMQSDLRESGSIEQDADVIAFLYRDEYYDSETEAKNITEVIIAKQRNGPVGTVELAFIKEYGLFVNLDRRHAS